MADDSEEYLDLVDENDVIVGRKPRSQVYAEGLNNFRVINVFIRNSAGQLWIPRRTAHKRLFPLHLDVSVGGHVSSGETYDDAFRRETMEELNIDIEMVSWRLLGKATPAHGLSAFQTVYEIPYDAEPRFNKNDFLEGYWYHPPHLLRSIEHGEKAKDDLPRLVRLFY